MTNAQQTRRKRVESRSGKGRPNDRKAQGRSPVPHHTTLSLSLFLSLSLSRSPLTLSLSLSLSLSLPLSFYLPVSQSIVAPHLILSPSFPVSLSLPSSFCLPCLSDCLPLSFTFVSSPSLSLAVCVVLRKHKETLWLALRVLLPRPHRRTKARMWAVLCEALASLPWPRETEARHGNSTPSGPAAWPPCTAHTFRAAMTCATNNEKGKTREGNRVAMSLSRPPLPCLPCRA